jgi:peptide deformylase
VLINPRVRVDDERVLAIPEACLSVTGYDAFVRRAQGVTVMCQDASGAHVKWQLRGLPAVVVQHECDHLDGVLLSDRAAPIREESTEGEAARDRYVAGLMMHYGIDPAALAPELHEPITL